MVGRKGKGAARRENAGYRVNHHSCMVEFLESSLILQNSRASRPPLRPLARTLVKSSPTTSTTNTVSRSIANCELSSDRKTVETAVSNAINDSITTALKWGAPVNREDRAAGGLHWSSYKAICRRNGVYSNAQGPHVSHRLSSSMIYIMLIYIVLGMERGAVSVEIEEPRRLPSNSH